MNEEITEHENEMHQLYESAGLFEVNIHDYKQLKVLFYFAYVLRTIHTVTL